MGTGCSVSATCTSIERYIAGYKREHIYLGIQVAVAFIIAMLSLTVTVLNDAFKNKEAVWTVMTVAVVMEPNMGGSLRKGVLRALGAVLGGGLAFGIMGISDSSNPENKEDLERVTLVPIVGILLTAGVSLCAFVLVVHKERYPKIDHYFFVALFTMPAVLASATNGENWAISYGKMGWGLINILSGIAIATLVSVFVFPIRARWVLQRDMASMLIRLGDLTVWVLSQVCVKPNSDFSFPGTSYSDKALTYSDNGVERRLAPLMDSIHRLGKQLAELSVLLVAADKEWHFFRKPRVFPTAKYKLLLERCHIVLSVETTLLYRLQSSATHMALVHALARDVRELGVRISRACTALSHLVHQPQGGQSGGCSCGKEAKGQGPAAWLDRLRLLSPWHGRVGVAAASSAEVAAAEAANTENSIRDLGWEGQGGAQQQQQQQCQQQQQRQRQGQQQLDADLEAPAAVAEDNPFAELVAAQLASEAQMQRLVPRELTAPDVASGVASPNPRPTPLPAVATGSAAAAAAERSRQGSNGRESRPGSRQGSSSGGSGPSSGQQQGEAELGAVALAQLRATVDVASSLLQALAIERASAIGLTTPKATSQHNGYICGALQRGAAYDTLSLVVHTGMDLVRQLAAMFTALDPGRATMLHDYMLRAVEELDELHQRLEGSEDGAATEQQVQ